MADAGANVPKKASGSWFGTDVKHCVQCGRGSTKADRATCKDCGCSEWVMVDSADGLKASMVSEAKMMNDMDGKEETGDIVIVCPLPDALSALSQMVQEKADAAKGGEHTWEFRGVHLGHGAAAGKTQDDLLTAFLYWAQKPADREAGRFNVSKAMRRLTAFAIFQEKYCEEFFADPVIVTEPGFANVAKIFPILIPAWTNKQGNVMWIMDLKQMEADSKEYFSDRVLMRYFWWLMLNSVFDYATAIDGADIVETFDGLSFGAMMKMNSRFSKVEKEMQELFYGVAPFKMKSCVLVGSPWWLNWLLAIMRLFISKKMSERIVNTDKAGMYQRLGGPDFFPQGFYEGTRAYVDRYQPAGAPETGP